MEVLSMVPITSTAEGNILATIVLYNFPNEMWMKFTIWRKELMKVHFMCVSYIS